MRHKIPNTRQWQKHGLIQLTHRQFPSDRRGILSGRALNHRSRRRQRRATPTRRGRCQSAASAAAATRTAAAPSGVALRPLQVRCEIRVTLGEFLDSCRQPFDSRSFARSPECISATPSPKFEFPSSAKSSIFWEAAAAATTNPVYVSSLEASIEETVVEEVKSDNGEYGIVSSQR